MKQALSDMKASIAGLKRNCRILVIEVGVLVLAFVLAGAILWLERRP